MKFEWSRNESALGLHFGSSVITTSQSHFTAITIAKIIIQLEEKENGTCYRSGSWRAEVTCKKYNTHLKTAFKTVTSMALGKKKKSSQSRPT